MTTKKKDASELDRDYAMSALFDVWALFNNMDDDIDSIELRAFVNCAIARIERTFDLVECMKDE